jgi:hypothetical protein
MVHPSVVAAVAAPAMVILVHLGVDGHRVEQQETPAVAPAAPAGLGVVLIIPPGRAEALLPVDPPAAAGVAAEQTHVVETPHPVLVVEVAVVEQGWLAIQGGQGIQARLGGQGHHL